MASTKSLAWMSEITPPRVNYTEQIITLGVQGTNRPRINAMVASNGLAYHLSPHYEQDTYLIYFGPDYAVTHVASGLSICTEATYFVSPAECERFITLIDDLMDWRQSKEECKAGKIGKRLILEMIKKATQEDQPA
jgi:hypothetical protein